MTKVESPCIANCYLDENYICEGCLRTLDEISDWSKLTNQEKREVLKRIQNAKVNRKTSL